MSRRRVVAGAAALCCVVSLMATNLAAAGARPPRAITRDTDRWAGAIEVPGTGVLNKGGNAGISSMSCALAGDCGAGGYYTDGSGHQQAFVATERHGRWRPAIEVPGTSALNKGGDADVAPVSCPSAGSCAAGGEYKDRAGRYQAFVVSEWHGRWRPAIEVPGTRVLNSGGNAQVSSMSCPSAGGCAAGGEYKDRAGRYQAFVVSEWHGRWRSAIEAPGTGVLNKGGFARADSVSCPSAGGCAAGGSYKDGSGERQAFVVSEWHGRWRSAIEVPGIGALNKGGDAEVFDMSCASPGSCLAGGWYTTRSGAHQAFVVSEASGAWRSAFEVPGTSRLNRDGGAVAGAVSCASAGNCAVGGMYVDGSGDQQAFLAIERHGAWRSAIEVPGTGALNKGGAAAVDSVSCVSAGRCAANGNYVDGNWKQQVFVVG